MIISADAVDEVNLLELLKSNDEEDEALSKLLTTIEWVEVEFTGGKQFWPKILGI